LPALPGAEHDFISIPVATVVWVLFSIVYLGTRSKSGRKIPGRRLIGWASMVLGAVVLWPMFTVKVANPWVTQNPVSTDQAQKILTSLIRNIYRAFDQRSESAVYDVLARSIQGDLLQKVYLQTANSLSLDSQESTRVRVTELQVDVDGVKQIPGKGGFVADVVWNALGTVGHWGHQHNRVNRYTAKITVKPDRPSIADKLSQAGSWKIMGLEILDEKRL
ncbi:MAG: hypothetical protein WCN98_08655, partial [Verrucomicrobiaceae bacterium]